MKSLSLALALVLLSGAVAAQPPGRWPPDSLVNTRVIPHSTPVTQVIGQMRNITGSLGVRCHFCHAGEEGLALERTDFASDDKRTKLVAREMMRMVATINAKLDSLPSRPTPALRVTCSTCHRGVSRPVPLSTIIIDAATAAGADSAIRAYRALRDRYYGGDSYDFREGTLNTAAFRLGRDGRYDDAFALLGLNEQLFPGSSAMYVFRGNIQLMKADTTAAAAAFREAIKRDPANQEARGRLRTIGQVP